MQVLSISTMNFSGIVTVDVRVVSDLKFGHAVGVDYLLTLNEPFASKTVQKLLLPLVLVLV